MVIVDLISWHPGRAVGDDLAVEHTRQRMRRIAERQRKRSIKREQPMVEPA